jgi:hypothetical protein
MQNDIRTEGTAHSRILSFLFFAAAALLALLTLALVYMGWRTGISLTPTSGTWIALAVDLKNGVLYRPMYGDLGYGGTRYFPLHFVLHAALMKIGLGPEAAGHTLEAFAGLTLLFGIYRVLRQLRIAPRTAACIPVVVLAPKATQIAILSIRGDLLPTALTVLGLATCMSARVERRRLLGASLLFTLAFAAKPTSLFGAAAVFLSFVFSRQVRKAALLLLATGLGCAAVLGAVSLASGGRFLTVFRACAATAGYSLPVGMWHLAIIPPLQLPVDLAILILGFAGFFALTRSKISSMPAMFFASAAVSTAIVLGAVGTNINHFLDIDVASLIVFSAWLFDEEPKERTFGVAALLFVALFGSCLTFWSMRHTDAGGYFDFAYSRGIHETLEFLGKQDKPILAAHPLLPILAGQRPYLLDLWMFRIVAEKDPSFAKSMSDAIRQRQFAAIVLEDDLASRTSPYYFPDRETEDIRQNYQLARRFPRAYVFLPRGPQNATAPAEFKTIGEH